MIAPGVLLVRETYWGHCAIEKEYGDKLDFIRPARTTIVPGVLPERLNLALNQSTPVSFLDTPFTRWAISWRQTAKSASLSIARLSPRSV